MSIGKRFVNMLRSNLNAILEGSSDDAVSRGAGGRRLEALSDEALEAELRARRQRRDAAQQAAEATPAEAPRRAAPRGVDEEAWQEVEDAMHSSRYRTTGRRQSRSYQRARRPTGGAGGRKSRMEDLYRKLECPAGADLDKVRHHYRKMMRKYHPDMHSGSVEKQRLATEVSQQLTAAYNELKRLLSAS
ncbi:MAG: J domain-containing protein [Deltaproteobacteria bacterium]|nr:J domain-containing protein [Deltaproteobacteria bacterium]